MNADEKELRLIFNEVYRERKRAKKISKRWVRKFCKVTRKGRMLMYHLLDGLDAYDISLTSALPNGYDTQTDFGIKYYIKQYTGHLGDDYSGTIYLPFKNRWLKLNYSC